ETNLRALLTAPDAAALLTALRPRYPQLHATAQAYRAFFSDDEQEADRWAAAAVTAAPQLYLGHLLAGLRERRSGNLASARSLLLTGLSLRPDSPDVHLALARLFADGRSCAAAREHLALYLLRADAVTDSQSLDADVARCR